MTDLLTTINNIREETLSAHYNAAVAELQEKIKQNPLKSTFFIYSGCVSEEITSEIAYRFQNGNLKAEVRTSGLVSSIYYLEITVALPSTLIHIAEVQEVAKPLETPDAPEQPLQTE